jgi:hypothetical protein
MPVKTGIQVRILGLLSKIGWIPAVAGMTG